MDEPTTCPFCHHKNLVGALICARCGTPLSNSARTSKTTQHVSEIIPEIRDQHSLVTSLSPGTLAILIDGKREPILLEDFERILLGRIPVTRDIPLLDLSLYDGLLRGVSRNHATITRKGDLYFLMDEGSSNGTRVNGTSIQPHTPHPVQNGDAVQLGQLSMRLYFNNSKTDIQTLHLQRMAPEAPFTPEVFADDISPFLLALSRVQNVVNTFLKRQATIVRIESFKIQGSGLQIQLSGASETIEFLKAKRPSLEPARAGKAIPGIASPDSAKKPSLAFENLSVESKAVLTELAHGILDEVSPPLQDQTIDFEPYIQKLLPDLYILATSDLRITNSKENG